MNSDSWDAISAQIRKSIIDERSILSEFPPEAASITAREIVLSLAADCSCKKAALMEAAPPPKRPLGRHVNNTTETKPTVMVRPTLEMAATTEARSKRFSVKLDTEADLQWVMQTINYGLTMPPEHWDIVAHSVHLYCEWLGCLLPAQSQKAVHMPRALLTSPAVYARRLLFALCRFFAPRAPMDRPTDGFFNLLHQPPCDPPDPACIASATATNSTVEAIARGLSLGVVQPNAGIVVGEGERWLQEKYIPLVSRIVGRVKQILYSSHLLTGPLWDNLLEFCLAVCYAVLALPPQIECSAITSSRLSALPPGVRVMLQLECLVAGLLNRVWIRALSQHYPSPAYWQGLQELCHVSRHRIGLSYIWSRMLVVSTCNLIRSQGVIELSCPVGALEDGTVTTTTTSACPLNLPPLSAFEPLLSPKFMVEVSKEVADISWFRLLHLFGNPVDLCHPAEITHTAVFECFRRSNAAARCRLTAVFLPGIFHNVMRSLSTTVDLFLGIAPSLSGCLSTFIGVPPSLYGPLVDIPVYFHYASVRSPDVNFLNKQQGSGDLSGSTDPSSPDGSGQTGAHFSSSLVNPQALAEAWLQPNFLVTCFYNRPHVASLLRLLGPWLFEAAVGRGKEGTIVSERSLMVDNTSFLVGRAEAMACLCRIFIYARKTQIAPELLARFYVCLVRALDPEVEYVLSTVLFHAPDLLRADLTACFSSVAPALFNAAQLVLRKPSVICPEYISMVLLRRASLHQLLSMVCLTNQFDGIQFQEISSPSSSSSSSTTTSDSSVLTTRILRMRLASLLCELLTYETDTHNLRMLLSAAYTLVLNMISVELSAPESNSKSAPNNVDPHPGVETASGLYAVLLERICASLRRWVNDFALSSFALDILGGLASTHVPQPSLARCRRCIQSICAFIEFQCWREKKDHTRLLHSLIINAFHCLGGWIVAHPNTLNDQETLRAVIETTKLGIFGDETVPLPLPGSKRGSSLEGPPLPTGMPFSKRVNEAAEQLLTILFSTAGSFPQAGGPETFSCRLNEERVAQLSATSISTFQHFLVSSPDTSASTPTAPDLLLSIAETMRPTSNTGSKRVNESIPALCRSLADPSPVFTFLRDASGRHLWSWKLRYEPISAENDTRAAPATQRLRNTKHFKSYLENSWPIRQSGGTGDPFLPKTRDNIPLVRAEKEMPTLAQSVFGSVARREVDALKSLIASEAERTAALGRRIQKARIKAFTSSYPEEQCRPQQRIDAMSSGHLLACHLGYVPVNALQGSSNSFCVPSGTNADSNHVTNSPQPNSIPNLRARSSGWKRRIPGTRNVGGGVDAASLIPSALIPVDATLARQLDDQLLTGPRSTATLFVFYVKQGQTSLEDVICNMDYWSETPKDFQSFLHSLGWCVDSVQHPGWCGPLQRSQSPWSSRFDATTMHLSGFDVRQQSCGVGSGAAESLRRNAPDGVKTFFYWADAFTEVVTLCPSKRTKIDEKPPEDRSSAEDFRAAVLWLESWGDALWVPGWTSESGGSATASASVTSNPLRTALEVQFSCSLVALVHPLASNGLFRLGLLQLHDLGHEAGPLTTGLLLSAPLLGAMVRSTLVNTLHRLAADSGDPTNTTARKRLAAVTASAATGSTKGRVASAVQLLLWSAERCY
ncbi:Ral GTPase-activating protein subunit beta [Echinococcus granulosus]|uniref:Ral GTPase activating protein subunit beta n=1 Tax=Echinococcus granulosus TaxID=6210 RepID=A0A068WCC9_ECHGR|nr:Ral GTPase-activating protein subunit beta [Echinococcus granulosus]CDS15230.1 ral GTPase activating protein subunit beta [Echinococcus granulosus]